MFPLLISEWIVLKTNIAVFHHSCLRIQVQDQQQLSFDKLVNNETQEKGNVDMPPAKSACLEIPITLNWELAIWNLHMTPVSCSRSDRLFGFKSSIEILEKQYR